MTSAVLQPTWTCLGQAAVSAGSSSNSLLSGHIRSWCKDCSSISGLKAKSSSRRNWQRNPSNRDSICLSVKAAASSSEGGESADDTWLARLPKKSTPLYSHSLPCIEAWLGDLGFEQGSREREVWRLERQDWHAELTLEMTDLVVRYLKSGPGSLGRDVERKFSYALSREDLQNAILSGP